MCKGVISCFLFVFVACTVACSGNVGFTPPPPGAGGVNMSGSTPREALLEKDIAVLEEASATLTNIKDAASLNMARPKLNDLMQKHKDINQDAAKLGLPTPQEKDAMVRKYGDRIKMAKGNLTREMVRVNQIPGGGDVYRQMVELGQAF
jgi:hypothetical protein